MKKSIAILRRKKGLALLLAITLFASVAVIPTFAYIFDMTSTIVNTFISGLDPEGDLIIRKKVVHPFGDNYVVPEGIAFDFQVSLGEQYAGQTIKTTEGDIVADDEGNIIVSVKANRSVGVCEILSGTEVTVTEIAQLPGFQIQDGVASQTATIPVKDDAIVTFVNTYSPAPVDSETLKISGIKNLEGRDWQEGDAFTFQLDYRPADSEDAQWITLGTDTVTYDAEKESFNTYNMDQVLATVSLDTAGTYYFRISEVEGAIGGITYDDLIRYFDVYVTDLDMNGILEINKVNGYSGAVVTQDEKTGSFSVVVDFNNVYAPVGSAESVITIFKQVESTSGTPMPPAGYSFGVFDSEGNQIAVSEPTPAAAETSIKLVFEASQAGQTFNYILKEIGAGEQINGIIYDSTEIPVTVSVIDNLDGTVRVECNVTKATFKNVYDPNDAIIQITGDKILEGRDMVEDEFRFNFYVTQEDMTLAEGATPVMFATNMADGKFSFDEIVFDRIGTYYFLISEDQSEPLEGVTYDATVYGVVVTVTDDGIGQLSASVEYSIVGGDKVDSIAFNNKYVEPEKPTPTGDEGFEVLYILLAAVSCLTVVVIAHKRKKRV